MASNPIQYSDKTFNTSYSDINAQTDLVDKPDWIKRIFAGSIDVLSMNLNAVANQCFLDTATSETAIDRLLALIDYMRTPITTCSGTVLFFFNRSVAFPFTVAQSNLVAFSAGSVSVSSKRFEATGAATFTAVTNTGTRSGNVLTVSRVFTTGELFRIAGAGLPSPLAAATDYYAIYVSDTSIKVASSLVNALKGTYITLTGAGSGTITLYCGAVTMYQQTTVSSYVVGRSDGTTAFQTFDIKDLNVLSTTIAMTIGVDTWTLQSTFVYSSPTDKHFRLFFRTDGSCYLMFGDGTYGAIPSAVDIYISYCTGGGVNSNVTVANKVNVYGGTDTNLNGAYNPGSLTGGSDRQAISSAKILGPLLLKARDRFVTSADGEALVLAYGGIGRCIVNKNVYGVLSAQVVAVPIGGGTLSAPVKAALDTYLTDRTEMETIDVRIVDPSYITQAFTSAFNVSSGYLFADVKPMYEFAVTLLLSELTYELQQKYDSDGIELTTTYINTLFSTSFTANDYPNIAALLKIVKAPQFGTSIEQSDVMFVLESVPGVNYLTISLPSAFPLTFATTEISHTGTITTTEIT